MFIYLIQSLLLLFTSHLLKNKSQHIFSIIFDRKIIFFELSWHQKLQEQISTVIMRIHFHGFTILTESDVHFN